MSLDFFAKIFSVAIAIGVSILVVHCSNKSDATAPVKKCTYSVWRGDTGAITCKQEWSSGNYTVILKDCDGGVVSVDKAVNIIKRCE
jgi:hypothetical protein